MNRGGVTTIDLLRHGEPVGVARYRGRIDDPLSEKGWSEMRIAVGDHRPWDTVVSSPLSRCSAFAQELGTRHALPVALEPRFREISFGDWEGRTAEDLMRSDRDVLLRFWRDPVAHPPPGAESLNAFRERVLAAWSQLIVNHQGKHLLLVCHGGVIRMIVSHVLEMPVNRMFRLVVPTASMTRIRVDHGDPPLAQLLFHAGRL